jgi:carboxylesterase type B
MMSGGPGLKFNTMSDLVANNTAAIARQVRCVNNDDAQSLETLDCLRKVPVENLTNLSVSASRAARPPFGEGFFYPTYDADFVPDRPSQSMRAGNFVKGVPVIASWVTNDGAWYVPPPTSTDEGVLASFGLWLYGLSEPTKAKLLDMYPVRDFEAMVRPNYDGDISPQYYRAAQLNRDIWFTCPVLDFAWQYVRNGGPQTSQVRLYEHNSTRYAPVFENMGVPMWRVAHLSDIPYVLNVQRLGGDADNSAEQLAQAKLVSQTIISFVSSGTPERDRTDFEAWPPAFSLATRKDLDREFPIEMSVQLFGGPYGNRAVLVSKANQGNVTKAEQAVRWEKLFERCEFITSAKVREEFGA